MPDLLCLVPPANTGTPSAELLSTGEPDKTGVLLVLADLWFTGRIIVVRWLVGDLMKHLVEEHEDYRVFLDQVLEFLDDWGKGLLLESGLVLDAFDKVSEPLFEECMTIRQGFVRSSPWTSTGGDRTMTGPWNSGGKQSDAVITMVTAWTRFGGWEPARTTERRPKDRQVASRDEERKAGADQGIAESRVASFELKLESLSLS
ncbi:hypothetical protein BDD12DRAFT_881449 [Trichophaea hybrida]|nr:hypothetical protein BDD12DRAFT_881449 [Trichophaea hybrida]